MGGTEVRDVSAISIYCVIGPFLALVLTIPHRDPWLKIGGHHIAAITRLAR